MTPPTKTEGPQMLGRTFRKTKAPPTNNMKEGLKDVGGEEKGQTESGNEGGIAASSYPLQDGTNKDFWQNFCTRGISVMECRFLFLSSHLAMNSRNGLE